MLLLFGFKAWSAPRWSPPPPLPLPPPAVQFDFGFPYVDRVPVDDEALPPSQQAGAKAGAQKSSALGCVDVPLWAPSTAVFSVGGLEAIALLSADTPSRMGKWTHVRPEAEGSAASDGPEAEGQAIAATPSLGLRTGGSSSGRLVGRRGLGRRVGPGNSPAMPASGRQDVCPPTAAPCPDDRNIVGVGQGGLDMWDVSRCFKS